MAVNDEDVLRATIIHDNTTSGEQVNVIQYQLTTAAPITDAQALDDVLTILEALYNIVKAAINIRNVLREVGLFNLTQDRIIGAGDLDTYAGGTGANPASPQGVAPYMHFKTLVPRVILSKYMPSPSQGTLDLSGNLTSVAHALFVSFAASLMTPNIIAGRTYTYGYLSPLVGVGYVVPVSAVVKTVLAYQRRRKTGRGS